MNFKEKQKIEEISLLKIAADIILHKRTVILTCGIFFVLGIVVAFLSPKYWSTSLSLLPEENSNSLGSSSLSGLASIAGVNLPTGSAGTIDPGLYPTILESTPFLVFLYDSEIQLEKPSQKMSLANFLKEYHRGFSLSPQLILSVFSSKDSGPVQAEGSNPEILELTEEELNYLKKIKNSIDVSVERKTGLVKISTEFQDPAVSAEVALLTTNYIQKYVSEYHTTRQRRKLAFLEEQLDAKKKLYDSSQEKLAFFKDSNIGVLTNKAEIELRNLENEFDMAFNIYSNVNLQLEEAKLALEEESVSFKLIEPVKKPIIKSKPKRLAIVVSFCVIGFIIAFVVIQIKTRYPLLKAGLKGKRQIK